MYINYANNINIYTKTKITAVPSALSFKGTLFGA